MTFEAMSFFFVRRHLRFVPDCPVTCRRCGEWRVHLCWCIFFPLSGNSTPIFLTWRNLRGTVVEYAHLVTIVSFFFYFTGKVKKKYESLGDSVLIVNLEKSHRGLGISLAGHKDRNRMAVFVCGINPNGAAFKTGGIEVGDEILEVSTVSLRLPQLRPPWS